MSPSAVNHRWMFVFKIFVLFSVILLQSHFCKASSTKKKHRLKNILFLSAEEIPVDPHFPSHVVFKEENGTHLCFNIQANQSNADCCGIEDFDCGTKINRLNDSTYSLNVSREILRKQDIVVLLNPMSNFSCMLAQLHNSTEFILDLDNCLKPGGRNIRITLDHLYRNQYNNTQTSEDSVEYTFKFGSKIISIVKIMSCESSDSAGVQQPLSLTFPYSNNVMTIQEAVNIMNNFSFYLDQMGACQTAIIKKGNVTGAIVKLRPLDQNQTALNFGFKSSGDVKILEEKNNVDMELVLQIQISKEVNEEAAERNSKYIGVLLFPGMPKQFESNSYLLNNKMLGIELGASIFNLSQTINIHYSNINTNDNNASCMSWDGQGNNQTWTADRCQTIQTNDHITCRCLYHPFIAVAITPFKPELTFTTTPRTPLNSETTSMAQNEDRKPEINLTLNPLNHPLGPYEAANLMKNLSFLLDKMGNASTAAIKEGNVSGVIARLLTNSTGMDFGFSSNGDAIILGKNATQQNTCVRKFSFPKEAIAMALQQNPTNYIVILLFKGMLKNATNNDFFNNEVIGIKMGANISNLAKTIDIQYNDVQMVQTEFKATCMSWDDNRGNDSNWTSIGCKTNQTLDSVTCQCSHLTFFGILRSSESLNEEGKPEKLLIFDAPKTPLDPDQAAKLMKNLSFILDLMGNSSTAAIQMGNITGVMSRLPKQNQTVMDFGFQSSGDVMILKANNNVVTNIKQTIHFPKEASQLAVGRNGSFTGVFLFPEIEKLNKTSSFFNNEIMAIEMGVNISNLSETIDIHFTHVNTTEFNATCVSWDGTSKEGGKNKWIMDGCLTSEANGSITCQCSHLTFFAILMSTDVQISSSDLKTLTEITKAGCGISMFFLGVALFMHFLIRKNKASEAVKILMNLFVALFLLNLCFLVNESIAKLKILAACVAMAAVLHYSMLATFTWFFMQALNLYFNLHQTSTDIKYYMCKIFIAGWVIPAVVVVGLLASSKYDYINISDDNGTSVTMCWIPDSTIHKGVNIGYYSIVFIFTLTVFISMVVQIKHLSSKKAKTQDNISTKKRFFSLLGLFCLLGITWGFAFFSYGPLLLPSYYIFTILNSFQGFFLFVYYYFSSRVILDNTKQSSSSSGTTENVYTSSPHG